MKAKRINITQIYYLNSEKTFCLNGEIFLKENKDNIKIKINESDKISLYSSNKNTIREMKKLSKEEINVIVKLEIENYFKKNNIKQVFAKFIPIVILLRNKNNITDRLTFYNEKVNYNLEDQKLKIILNQLSYEDMCIKNLEIVFNHLIDYKNGNFIKEIKYK